MQVATTGLVLRQVKVGEADQILTLLTPDLGVISASAKGSLRLKTSCSVPPACSVIRSLP